MAAFLLLAFPVLFLSVEAVCGVVMIITIANVPYGSSTNNDDLSYMSHSSSRKMASQQALKS